MTESRSISVVVSAMSSSAACQRLGDRERCVVRSDGGVVRVGRASGREQGRLDAFGQSFLGGKGLPVGGQTVGDAGGGVGDALCVVGQLERGKLVMDGRGGR